MVAQCHRYNFAAQVPPPLRHVGVFLLALLLWAGSWRTFAAESALLFAPLPLENPASTQARNQPLADLLARLLQRPVKLQLCADHACLIDALANGRIDLAELGPLPFLLARDQLPELQAVASFREPNGEANYRCTLVAPVDGLTSLAALAEADSPARIALTSAQSTCGPTASLWLLAEHGIEPARIAPSYLGGHDEVALAVLRQRFPIGGVKDSVAARFHALGLRVLATSEPMPGFVLVAQTRRLSLAELGALTEALVNLPAEQRGGLQNGRDGFERFTCRLFDRVETMRDFSIPWLERFVD